MSAEILNVISKGEVFEIKVENEQKGSSYSIILSQNTYEQLRQYFVSSSSSFDEGYEKGWTDATSQAINEIHKIYKPNDYYDY